MKTSASSLSLLLLTAMALAATPSVIFCQAFASSNDMPSAVALEPEGSGTGGGSVQAIAPAADFGPRPFSRITVGANISPLGVGFVAASNINRHLDVRADGSFFNYTEDNFSTQGFNIDAKINFASARASVDYYPFHFGLRLSPGVMYYNGNTGSFNIAVAPGQSFTLNGQTYYSAQGADAVQGTGNFGLGNGSPSFTLTTGWGKIVPNRRHISFPWEVGVAFTKDPTLNFNLSGYACDATGVNCVNVATNPQIQANLAAQVQKYQSDLNPLKTYPIASVGVAYTFGIRSSR